MITGHDYRLSGAGRSYRIKQRLHSGRLPPAGGRAAIFPADIADGMWFVVQIKQNSWVSLKFGCYGSPEGWGMIHVGHSLRTVSQCRSGRRPMQIQHRIESILVEQIDKIY